MDSKQVKFGRSVTEMWEPMPCGHQNMFLYAIPGAPEGLQCALCRIRELETAEPEHDCATDDRRFPIDRPCAACSGGDPEMKYHLHCPPFRPEPVTSEERKLSDFTCACGQVYLVEGRVIGRQLR